MKQIPNSGFPSSLNQRGVRTKFCELIDTFKKQEAKEERASGIDAVFDEKTELLTDIHSRMVDYEKGFVEEKHLKQEKKDKEKGTAEEMRCMACENIGRNIKATGAGYFEQKKKGQ